VRRATLVTSAAYVNSELAAEFGRLPPSFLPVGLRRLVEHQLEVLGAPDRDLFLSLPEGFVPSEPDLLLLEGAGVTILTADPELSLGRSVHACLLRIGERPDLEILHGDTLIRPPRPFAADLFSVGDARDGYAWAAARIEEERIAQVLPAPPDRQVGPHRHVLSGYFTFSDTAALLRLLEEQRFDFVAALDRYTAHRVVRAVAVDDWLDFGHVQTLFRSRAHMAAARSFNHLEVASGVVTKRSDNDAKLVGEAAWLRGAPARVQIYTARLIDSWTEEGGRFAYSTEYEHLPTLAELYVFGRLNRPTWSRIMDGCAEYLGVAASIRDEGGSAAEALQALAVHKTRARLEEFARATGYDLALERRINGETAPSLERVAEEVAEVVAAAADGPATLMHGDFCFSNILYNSRVQRIRLIDPRGGFTDSKHTVFGDHRYDVAKLAHSVVGRYDLLMCGRAACTQDGADYTLSFPADPDAAWLEEAFTALTVAGERCDLQLTWAVMVGLFLSMLPLHADRPDRQVAFIANALRLHQKLVR
jgi:hypothetical protein